MCYHVRQSPGPENPYYLAAVGALGCVYGNGKSELGADLSQISIGGSSAQVNTFLDI